jgi:hypothetical protein
VEQSKEKFKIYEKMVWPEHNYLKFVLEIFDLLGSIILPKKRNEKFFKGVEASFEDKTISPSHERLKKILSKFYQNAFGSKTLKEINKIENKLGIEEDNCISFSLQKEEMANYEEECFDLVLDLDEYHARQRRTFPSAVFHRTNFHDYYLRFFVSKCGLNALLDFARGLSPFQTELTHVFPSVKKDKIISTQYLLPILKLGRGLLNELPKLKKYNQNIAFDGNALRNSQMTQEGDVLGKERTPSPGEERVLHEVRKPVDSISQETLVALVSLGLEFLCKFSLENTFNNSLKDVIETLFFVEELSEKVRNLRNGKEILEKLSVKAQSNKITKKLFLNILQNLIKLYLENPNYTQKMTVADFLNDLPSSVTPITP